jgi:hypothetical protein
MHGRFGLGWISTRCTARHCQPGCYVQRDLLFRSPNLCPPRVPPNLYFRLHLAGMIGADGLLNWTQISQVCKPDSLFWEMGNKLSLILSREHSSDVKGRELCTAFVAIGLKDDRLSFGSRISSFYRYCGATLRSEIIYGLLVFIVSPNCNELRNRACSIVKTLWLTASPEREKLIEMHGIFISTRFY